MNNCKYLRKKNMIREIDNRQINENNISINFLDMNFPDVNKTIGVIKIIEQRHFTNAIKIFYINST